MNVEDMTFDELKALVESRAGDSPASSVRHITVDGMGVAIDTDAVKSWRAFRLASKLDGTFDADTVDIMMQFIDLVTDTDETGIIEHCGGDRASLEDVVRVASLILTECYPKN